MIALLQSHYELMICDHCGEILDRPYKVKARPTATASASTKRERRKP
jgi:hypothetical protein